MAKLWDFYNGEPFMENPHVAIIGNPKRKHNSTKGKTMAKRAYHHKARRSNPKRHRRARRNPFPVAGLTFNPRHRRRHNPKRRHHMHNRRHRSYRRNPAFLGVALPPFNMIAFGAAGFIATPMLERTINSMSFMPASVTGSTMGRYAVKIGSALVLTFLAKTVLGQKEAFPVAMGGALYVVVSAINEFAPQLTGATTTATSAYRSGQINAYRGGMVQTGIGSYARGVNAALPGLARPLTGLAYGPSAMIPANNINYAGMSNPVFADPRFTANANIPR